MSATRITSGNLAERLVTAVPEFEPALEAHREEYGEVLNHLLFGDLVRFVEEAEGRGDWELIERCLGFLDGALASGDEDVVNVIAASFVENLKPWEARERGKRSPSGMTTSLPGSCAGCEAKTPIAERWRR